MTDEPLTATGWIEREERRRAEAREKARPRSKMAFDDPRIWAVMNQLSKQAVTEAQTRFADQRNPDPIEVAAFAAHRATDLAMGHLLERDEEYLAMRADRDRLAANIINFRLPASHERILIIPAKHDAEPPASLAADSEN